MTRALVIVDLQVDFLPGGTLAVDGGDEIIEPINKLIESNEFNLVIATKDDHPKDHVSFASSHGKNVFEKQIVEQKGNEVQLTLWPDHCVQNTYGNEFAKNLNTKKIDYIVCKGRSTESYSAFRDVFGDPSTDLEEVLKSNSVNEVFIVGLALDYCVLYTALDAARAKFKTTVKLDYTKAITPEGGERAIAELKRAGVICI